MSDETKPVAPAAPVAYVPPSQINPAELMKALQEDGVIEAAPAPEAPKAEAAPAPVETPPPPPAKEDIPTLLKIAQERDAARKAAQAKQAADPLSTIPPNIAKAIAQAIASGDPVSLLSAAGMTHAQYNARLLGIEEKKAESTPESKENSLPPEIHTLREELNALRQERERERFEQGQKQALGMIRDVLTKDAETFRFVNKAGDFDAVMAEINDHFARTGQLEGETFEQTVKLAAARREAYYQEMRKILDLTDGVSSASVSSKTPGTPSPGTVSTRTLTNSNTSAPAPVKQIPKTRDEILAAIIAGQTDGLE